MKNTRNKNLLFEIKSAYIEFQRNLRLIKQNRKALLSEYRQKLEEAAQAKISKNLKNV